MDRLNKEWRGASPTPIDVKCLTALSILAVAVFWPHMSPAHPALRSVFAALGHVASIDAVALSPNGKMLAWTQAVQQRSATTIVTREEMYVAPIDRPATAKRISGCPTDACDNADFAWSPDSQRLAFLTTGTDAQAELNVVRVDSGAVQRLTARLHGPLSSPKWAPDGRRVAILYTPGAPKAPGPLNPLARDAGVLGSSYYEQRIAIVTLDGAALRFASPKNLYVYEYDWSPDGTTFAASGAHGSGDDNWWIADLYTISAANGAATKLYHPLSQIASPRWSPDGKRIAYIGGLMSDETITGGDVYIVSTQGNGALDVTPKLNASITTIAWNRSSRNLTVTYLQGGSMGVGTVDTEARTFRSRWSAAELIFANSVGGFAPGDRGISIANDGRRAALIRQSFRQAPHIVTGSIGAWQPFIAPSAAPPHIVSQAQSISWTSDGFRPQGWLLYPDGYTSGHRYPMVVIVHGGPSYANYAAYPTGPSAYDAMLVSQGYFVFEPNPRGSYGQGEAFTKANVKDFGGGDLRDVLAGIKAAERSVAIDDKRVGIFGWSYGGYMTMWAVTQTQRFSAAVSGAGLSDWLSYYGTNNISTWMTPFFGKSVYDDPAVYAKSSPIDFIKRERTPMLLIAGDRDAEVPITQSYEYWNALRSLHVPTQFVVYPNEGHEFGKVHDQLDVAARLVGWFDRWLGKP